MQVPVWVKEVCVGLDVFKHPGSFA